VAVAAAASVGAAVTETAAVGWESTTGVFAVSDPHAANNPTTNTVMAIFADIDFIFDYS
jgi:hypothetical protein